MCIYNIKNTDPHIFKFTALQRKKKRRRKCPVSQTSKFSFAYKTIIRKALEGVFMLDYYNNFHLRV